MACVHSVAAVESVDPDGTPTVTQVWERALNPGASVAQITTDPQGNVIIAGWIGKDQITYPRDQHYRMYLAKVSGVDGSILWERAETDTDPGSRAVQALTDPTGDIIVSGLYWSVGDQFPRIYLAKYSGTDGSRLWEVIVDSLRQDGNFPWDLELTNNGDVILSGYVVRQSTIGQSPHIARYAGATGQQLWLNTTAVGHDIALDAAGDVYLQYGLKLSGATGAVLRNVPAAGLPYTILEIDHEGNLFGDDYVSGPDQTIDFTFSKHSASTGAELWSKQFPGPITGGYDLLKKLAIDSENRLAFIGYSFSGSQSTVSAAVYSPQGQSLWQLTYNDSSHRYAFPDLVFGKHGEVIIATEVQPLDIWETRVVDISAHEPATGQLLWDFSIPWGQIGSQSVLAATPDGGVAVALGIIAPKVRKLMSLPRVTGATFTLDEQKRVSLKTTIDGLGYDFTVHFEWGASGTFGNSTPIQTITADQTGIITVSAPLPALEPGTYYYRIVIETASGTQYSREYSLVVPNSPPVAFDDRVSTEINKPIVIEVATNDNDADGDPLTILSVGEAGDAINGTVSIGTVAGTVLYTPGHGFAGIAEFTYSVGDGRGATAKAKATVEVLRPSFPSVRVIAATGQPVGSSGAVVSRFLYSDDQIFAAAIKEGNAERKALIDWLGNVVLRSGDVIPGTGAGEQIQNLDVPSGQAAIAKLKPVSGNSSRAYAALIRDVTGGVPQVIGREGGPAAELSEVAYERFLSFDGTGPNVFFTATLRGTAVNRSNNQALFVALPDGAVRLLARKGDLLEGQPIKTIATLIAGAGSVAEGRWVDGNNIAVRFTLSGGLHAIYSIPTSADSPTDWRLWARSQGVIETRAGAQSTIMSLGLPSVGAGGQMAYLAKVREEGVRAETVMLVADDGSGPRELSRVGTSAAFTPAKIRTINDPAMGAVGRLAFLSTLRGGGASGSAIFYGASSQESLPLVARTGSEPPGIPGASWAGFSSMTLANSTDFGLMFVGTLRRGSSGVAAQNDTGLWASDSNGALRLAFREGQSVKVAGAYRTVATFRALTTAGRTAGSPRGYTDRGLVYVVATFTDRTQAVLEIVLP